MTEVVDMPWYDLLCMCTGAEGDTPCDLHKIRTALGETLATLEERPEAQAEQRCVSPPVGCGGPADTFRDALSQREYGLSAFCQQCQDAFFGV